MPDRFTIPPTTPPGGRPAEASDARLRLRDHDEDLYKRQEGDTPHDPLNPQDVYDQTILGVRALIDFLANFIRTYNVQKAGDAAATPSPRIEKDKPDQINSTNPLAARAASAYAHTAHTVQHVQDLSTNISSSTTMLDGVDIAQIQRVIEKLQQLATRGIEGLQLTRSSSFVQSIENAADALLNP